MTPTVLLIASVLVQGGIAFVLLGVLGLIRIPLVMRGKIRLDQVALSREPWPLHEKRVANAFDNQFQVPVLFYAASGLSLYFGPVWFEVVLAWVFVLTRIVHAAVFATNNDVVRRFFAYAAGCVALAILWLDLTLRLLLLLAGGR